MVDDRIPMRLWHERCDLYLAAIEAFLAGGDAREFAEQMKRQFGAEDVIGSRQDVSWAILSQVFQDAIAFYSGDVEVDEEDLGEQQLRQRMSFAHDALVALRAYAR